MFWTSLVDEIEHCFGSNARIGIPQQLLDGRLHGLVADGGENRDGLLSDFGRRMLQQTAYHWVNCSMAFDFEQAESVENFLRIGTEDSLCQQVCCRAV